MTYDQLFKNIQAGHFAPVYFFYGEEQFVKARAIERLREALLPEGLEDLNEAVLESESGANYVTAGRIIDAAEMLPVMADKRLVVVNDWGPLIAGRSRDESEEADRMAAWIPNAPETCVLVFSLRASPDGRKKAVTALKKHAEVVEFRLLLENEIERWLNQSLRPLGKTIAPDAVAPLTFLAGRALIGLQQEMNKLSAYIGERAVIERADVEAVVTPTAESTIFQMIDALMSGNTLLARQLLKSLLERGESKIGALAMITRQMRMLTHIKLMRAQGTPLQEITRSLALNSYAAETANRQAGRFTAETLETGYRTCVEADYAIKSGRMRDDAALDGVMRYLEGMS